jgi:hypothetical protein
MRAAIMVRGWVGWACLGVQVFAAPAGGAEVAPPAVRRYVAVDNVCAWPNLTRLGDGTIAAIIHNQPSHGEMEGQVECWTSADGEWWVKRGYPAPNDPQTVRMNVAAGLAGNGDLVVLCSGWTDVRQPERPKQAKFRDAILRLWVCRSSDGGRTWTQHKEFPAPDAGWGEFIPFGDMYAGSDGALHVSCYGGRFTDPTQTNAMKEQCSWHFRSDDDGKTWRRSGVIGSGHNETTLFPLGGQKWLAVARIDPAVDVFRSDDDGATWTGPQRVTSDGDFDVNGHVTRLADRRLVLSYGSRRGQFGVLARISRDEGMTWGDPLRIAHSLERDCGYPSTVQRADGKLVTAYYTKGAENHERYHMGVAIWEAPP